MNETKYEVLGLAGFILSGACFTVSGIINGDPWAVLGSLIWIVSCIVWLLPFVKNRRDGRSK